MESPLKISVSGVRGVVNSSLTSNVAFEFGQAFGTFTNCGKIAVARDTRTSGDMIKAAAVAGLLACGCQVCDIGIVSTPTALFYVRKKKMDGGIIITASHNPGEWNGLKFVSSDGTFLSEERLERFFDIYYKKEFRNVSWDLMKPAQEDQAASDLHMKEVLRHLDVKAIRRKHFKVGVDYINGTGCFITPAFLEQLGCRVYGLNDTPDGRFAHEPEPLPKNIKGLSRLVRAKRLDVGFAQDPDADRLAVVSEKGRPIGEELTLAFAMKFIISYRKKGPVVANLSASMVLDDIAARFGVRLTRAKVGESNVVSMMKKKNAVIGGEGNGGVIFPSINYGRDSIVGMGLILEYLAKSGKSVSGLVAELPSYEMIKEKIECPFAKAADALAAACSSCGNARVDTTDGIKMVWPDKWVHVRNSNTEPIIRIIAEARSRNAAEDLYTQVSKKIKEAVGI